MACVVYFIGFAMLVFCITLCSIVNDGEQPNRITAAQRITPPAPPETDSEAVREAIEDYERCAKDWRDDITTRFALCGSNTCTAQQLQAMRKLQAHMCGGY